jgi:hypothetical protein
MSTDPNPITFDYKRKAFVSDGKLIAGLHPTLQSLIYPHYNWKRAHKLNRHGLQSYTPMHTHGIRAGVKLDSEIGKTVSMYVKHQLNPSVFYSVDDRRKAAAALSFTVRQKLDKLCSSISIHCQHFALI